MWDRTEANSGPGKLWLEQRAEENLRTPLVRKTPWRGTYMTSATTRPTPLPVKPITRAAPFERSSTRPRMNGPRSLTVTTTLPDAATTPWPLGDLIADEQLPANVDRAALNAALDLALDDSRHPVAMQTRALIVAHQGRIIGERYAPGFTQDTRHITWSMGKSITAALIGLLVKDGHFTIDDPAPIEEWRRPGDP